MGLHAQSEDVTVIAVFETYVIVMALICGILLT